jgi:M6 family metalloprotease-like protein
MCVVCVTVAGTVVVASQIAPTQLLSDFTSSQKTLTSFAGSSSTLSSKQRSEIKVLVDGSPDADAVVCTGLTLKGASRSVITTARSRAKASCDYAKRLRPALSSTVLTRTTSVRTNAGKVSISVRTPKETPVPEAPVTKPAPDEIVYAAPSMPSDPVDVCRMKEASNSRGMTWAGFPDKGSMTAKTGVVKWALIPIDFPDLPGEKDFRVRVDDQMKLLSEWYETVSGGKFKVEWVVLDRWATLPGPSTDYTIDRSDNVDRVPNGPKLFTHAMNAADPLVDFTGVQTVNFLLPKGQTFLKETSQGFPWDQVVKDYRTKEGSISSYAIPGQYFDAPGRTYWSYWAHEFGHAIGLPHIGSSRGFLPPMNPWDLMGGQDGASRELSGWLRVLAGWLNDDQIFCKDAGQVSKVEITLVPLSDDEKGVKLAMLPLSATKLLIIESRRETKFSCQTTPSRNGVLVYTYDATLGHGENFLAQASPLNRPNQRDSCSSLYGGEPNPDFLLRAGDKVVVGGLTVEVLAHGNLDKVVITRN